MNKIFLGLIVAAIAYYFVKGRHSVAVDRLNFAALDSQVEVQSCFSKNYCLVVYVAPWCPACHQFIAQYRQFAPRMEQKNLGILFIVGADDDRKNEIQMRESLRPVSALDNTIHDFMKTHKINSFPTVMVLEKSNKVLYQGQSAFNFLNEKLNEP